MAMRKRNFRQECLSALSGIFFIVSSAGEDRGSRIPASIAFRLRIAPVLVHHGFVAENLGIAAVDILELLDVAFEETFGLRGIFTMRLKL